MVLGSGAAGFSGWSCPSSEKPVMTKRTGQPQRGVKGREQVRGTIMMKTTLVIDALCAKHRAKPPISFNPQSHCRQEFSPFTGEKSNFQIK